jgi:hypothetical protein
MTQQQISLEPHSWPAEAFIQLNLRYFILCIPFGACCAYWFLSGFMYCHACKSARRSNQSSSSHFPRHLWSRCNNGCVGPG